MPIETNRCPKESQETCKTYFALGRPLIKFSRPVILFQFFFNLKRGISIL